LFTTVSCYLRISTYIINISPTNMGLLNERKVYLLKQMFAKGIGAVYKNQFVIFSNFAASSGII